MTLTAIGIARWASGVDQTTPFGDAVSGSAAGPLGFSAAIPFPTITKTVSGSLICLRVGGLVSPGSTTSAFTIQPPSGYTFANAGVAASPNAGNAAEATGLETTASATGASTPSATTPTSGTSGARQLQDYAVRASCLRPSTVGTQPVIKTNNTINASGTSFAFTLVGSAATNTIIWVDVHLDDPGAVVTAPDGTWTQAYSVAHTNGVIVGFYKIGAPATTPGTTYTFGMSVPATAVPSNTVAPVVTGTAAVGSTLTSDNGTWTQSPTGYTYQWTRGGTNISGATASTYTVVSADAGFDLRCKVTATNSFGSTTANSNLTSIPAAPVNTVAPALSRVGGGTTYATGDTVSCNGGTFTGTGITKTFQWYRGASPLTGETNSTYTLVVSDEGANIRCDVTATNGGGAATASSNTIVPAVTAAISDASYLNYYSGGTSNTDPALSIGGARGGTWPGAVNDLFGPILGTVAQSGGVLYRLVYVRNTHTITTATAGQVYVESQFPSASGLELAVGVPVEAANVTVTAVASGTTPPSGVTFTTGTDTTFGDLAPAAFRGLWLRLTVTAGAPKAPVGSPDAAGWAIAFSS